MRFFLISKLGICFAVNGANENMSKMQLFAVKKKHGVRARKIMD